MGRPVDSVLFKLLGAAARCFCSSSVDSWPCCERRHGSDESGGGVRPKSSLLVWRQQQSSLQVQPTLRPTCMRTGRSTHSVEVRHRTRLSSTSIDEDM